MSIDKILILIIIGLMVGGMWVQYRFTGNIFSNIPKQELCSQN